MKAIEPLLFEMIRTESHPDAKGQERRLAFLMRDVLRRHGVTAELQPVTQGRCNLIAKVRGQSPGPRLLFNGHLDTVPPGAMRNPFAPRVRNGRIYGRGSVDMKGALAVMMQVMIDLRREKLPVAGEVILAATIAEEVDSIGADRLLESGFHADYAIIGEPTGLRVGVAHKGVVRAQVDFTGRSAHGSVPEQGINAIHHASAFVDAVRKVYLPGLSRQHHPLLGHPTANIGVIQGGSRPNIVPDQCVIHLEKRTLPGETERGVIAEFRTLIRRLGAVERNMRAAVSVMPVFNHIQHGAFEGSPRGRLACELGRLCAREAGVPEAGIGLQYWTDAFHFSERGGIETVVCGPGDIAQAHSNEEFIARSQLEAAYRIYRGIAIELCAAGRNAACSVPRHSGRKRRAA